MVVRHRRSLQTGRKESSSQENLEHFRACLWIYLWECSVSWGHLEKSFSSAETLVLHLLIPPELLETEMHVGMESWHHGTESWSDGTESRNRIVA